MAIDAFESKGTMLGFPGIFALLVYNGFAGYIVFSGLLKDVRMWVVFLMALPVSLWYDYKLIETIRNRIHAEEYHQEQIDLLEGRLGIMSDELAESMKRMSDRGYLDALRSHGVDVPEYFYKRLGSEEGTFAEPEGIEEAESYYLNV